MDTTQDLNVVLIPDYRLTDEVIDWSRLISAKYKTKFTLEKGKYNPHISLYQARYPRKDITQITGKLKKIAASFIPFQITLKGLSKHWGFIFFDVKPNAELQKLHEKIVDTLNPLRNNLIAENQLSLTGLTIQQKKSIEKYGHVFVKKTYVPHLSITYLADPSEVYIATSILPKKKIKFTVKGMALGSVAEYGSCPKILKKYPFKNS